jgi:hypothetical protein
MIIKEEASENFFHTDHECRRQLQQKEEERIEEKIRNLKIKWPCSNQYTVKTPDR